MPAVGQGAPHAAALITSPAAAPARQGLLQALEAEVAALGDLLSSCRAMAAAVQAAEIVPVAQATMAQQAALERWREGAAVRARRLRELAEALGVSEDALIASFRASADAPAELAAAWTALHQAAAEVRRCLSHLRRLLYQARAFTAFALQLLAGSGGADVYTHGGTLATPRLQVGMDRRG
jgi:transcriptional regulator with XRE-family HTH domain